MTDQVRQILMTVEEVARCLRLKTATVYEAAADGRIPCVRLWKGRRKALIRFRADDIEKLIEERTLATNSEGR